MASFHYALQQEGGSPKRILFDKLVFFQAWTNLLTIFTKSKWGDL